MSEKEVTAPIFTRIFKALCELRKQGREPKAIYIGLNQFVELDGLATISLDKCKRPTIDGDVPIFQVVSDDHFNVVADEPNVKHSVMEC